MSTLTTTVRARLPDTRHDADLFAMGAQMGSLMRGLLGPFAKILKIKDKDAAKAATADLKTQTCARNAISARYYNSAAVQAEGAVRGLIEGAKERLPALRKRKREAEKKMKTAEAAVASAFRAVASGRRASGPDTDRYLADLRRSARAAARKADKAEERIRGSEDRIEDPTGIMIGRGVMRRREAMGEDAFARAWRDARDGDFLVVGSGDETDGNQSCKIDLSDLDRGVFHLRLRPLTAGRATAGWIEIRDVPVNDHARPHLLALRARWEARKAENAARKADGLKPLKGAGEPVSFRFKARARRGAGSAFEVLITIREPLPDVRAVGVNVMAADHNRDHLAWAVVNPHGNLVASGRIPLPLRQKASGQRAAILADAAADLVRLAQAHGCGEIALEELDFSGKAPTRYPDQNRTAAAMPTRKLRDFATRRALRAGMRVTLVDPAGTSVLGRVNHAYPQGISVHTGAAIAIARRAMGISERIRRHRCFPVNGAAATEDAASQRVRTWRQALSAIDGFAARLGKSGARRRAPATVEEWRSLLAPPAVTRARPTSRASAGAGSARVTP